MVVFDHKWIRVDGHDWSDRLVSFELPLRVLLDDIGEDCINSPQAVWAWFRERCDGLPDDAAPRFYGWDMTCGQLRLVVQSLSYAPLEPGSMAPRMVPVFKPPGRFQMGGTFA